MTFPEKSAAITVAGLVLPYGAYAAWALSQPRGMAESMMVLSGLVVVQVIVMVVAHIAVAIQRRPEPRDERDRAIELRGPRNAYFVMVCGLVGAMALAWTGASALMLVNAMLAVLVVAEIVRYGSQLIYYRRGG